MRVRRYRCTWCGHVWQQNTSKAAPERAKISRRGLRWALEGMACAHLSMSRVAGPNMTTSTRALAMARGVVLDVMAAYCRTPDIKVFSSLLHRGSS